MNSASEFPGYMNPIRRTAEAGWDTICLPILVESEDWRGPDISKDFDFPLIPLRPYQPSTHPNCGMRLQRLNAKASTLVIPHWPVRSDMLTYTIMEHDGVLVLTPNAPLKQEDFAGLSATVDTYLAKHEKLHGMLFYAKRFPGWEDVSGFTAHMHFARDHRDKVERIAIATDSMIAGIAESLAKIFTLADVRRFGYSEPDVALGWLRAQAGRDLVLH